MAAGRPYFAWVEASETTFQPSHLRWDENLLEFNVEQAEGNFASLRITVRNPRVGLLNIAAGRKLHAWFAIDCGGGNYFKIFTRLVGIPSDILHDTVTLEFIARPSDYEEQKLALAESLKVLPAYDRIFIDPQAEEDPDTVLEGYGARWHVGRENWSLTISDELQGEDGTLSFGDDEMLHRGLAMNINGSPATTATVDVEFSWTQLGGGGIDLTRYITDNWPNEEGVALPGTITSFTLRATSWPQAGSSAGDGWVVSHASCSEIYDIKVRTETDGGKTTYRWPNGSVTELESFQSVDGATIPPGSVEFARIITRDEVDVDYGSSGVTSEEGAVGSNTEGEREVTNFRRDYSETAAFVPLIHLIPRLAVRYDAKRPFVERVRFSLTADVQPVLSDPEDGMILRMPEMKSVNLSEEIEDSSDGEIPIGDPSRRSYLVTARGQDSIKHVISLLRAALRTRSRVVEITFEPLLERMHEVTLRKSAVIEDSRLPRGLATGKIIAYSLGLNGSTGELKCSVTIGCAVGRGGSITAVDGDPEYVEDEYILKVEDYQQYIGAIVLVDAEGDVGFTPPLFAPNDDGVDFLSSLTAEDVIEDDLVVSFPPAAQRLHLEAHPFRAAPSIFVTNEQIVEERRTALQATLQAIETTASIRLVNMEGLFETPIEVDVTGLKIPQGINLET